MPHSVTDRQLRRQAREARKTLDRLDGAAVPREKQEAVIAQAELAVKTLRETTKELRRREQERTAAALSRLGPVHQRVRGR